jgi:hypothetical protein
MAKPASMTDLSYVALSFALTYFAILRPVTPGGGRGMAG